MFDKYNLFPADVLAELDRTLGCSLTLSIQRVICLPQINAASVQGVLLMLLLSSDALWAPPVVSKTPLRRSEFGFEPFKGQGEGDVLGVFVWMWGQNEWKEREAVRSKVRPPLLRNVFVSRRIAA